MGESQLTSGIDSGPGALRSGSEAWAGVHDLTLQDEVATNLLTIDATDPKSGTAEFKATAIRLDKIAATHD